MRIEWMKEFELKWKDKFNFAISHLLIYRITHSPNHSNLYVLSFSHFLTPLHPSKFILYPPVNCQLWLPTFYSPYQFIFRVKNMVNPRTANNPMLPTRRAYVSSCIKTKINPKEKARIKVWIIESLHFLKNVLE